MKDFITSKKFKKIVTELEKAERYSENELNSSVEMKPCSRCDEVAMHFHKDISEKPYTDTQNKSIYHKEVEALQEELTDLVDKYFPKIEPFKGNKGRGEAMMIMATALIGTEKILKAERSRMLGEVIGEDENEVFKLNKNQPYTNHEIIDFLDSASRKIGRNQLRAEQRKSLDKQKG